MSKYASMFILGMSLIGLVGCGSSISDNIEKDMIKEYAAGIYNISTMDDIIYFSIEDRGLVNTYSLDTDNNCYKKNEVPGLNSSINGRKLIVNYNQKVFEIDSVRWYYGNSKKISEVRIDNVKSSGILESGNIKIATSEHLTSNITLGELNQSLCF